MTERVCGRTSVVAHTAMAIGVGLTEVSVIRAAMDVDVLRRICLIANTVRMAEMSLMLCAITSVPKTYRTVFLPCRISASRELAGYLMAAVLARCLLCLLLVNWDAPYYVEDMYLQGLHLPLGLADRFNIIVPLVNVCLILPPVESTQGTTVSKYPYGSLRFDGAWTAVVFLNSRNTPIPFL